MHSLTAIAIVPQLLSQVVTDTYLVLYIEQSRATGIGINNVKFIEAE